MIQIDKKQYKMKVEFVENVGYDKNTKAIAFEHPASGGTPRIAKPVTARSSVPLVKNTKQK